MCPSESFLLSVGGLRDAFGASECSSVRIAISVNAFEEPLVAPSATLCPRWRLLDVLWMRLGTPVCPRCLQCTLSGTRRETTSRVGKKMTTGVQVPALTGVPQQDAGRGWDKKLISS